MTASSLVADQFALSVAGARSSGDCSAFSRLFVRPERVSGADDSQKRRVSRRATVSTRPTAISVNLGASNRHLSSRRVSTANGRRKDPSCSRSTTASAIRASRVPPASAVREETREEPRGKPRGASRDARRGIIHHESIEKSDAVCPPCSSVVLSSSSIALKLHQVDSRAVSMLLRDGVRDNRDRVARSRSLVPEFTYVHIASMSCLTADGATSRRKPCRRSASRVCRRHFVRVLLASVGSEQVNDDRSA